MTPAQKKAAAELAAGPRGGVRGPFVPLLRSPELMDRLQKVGEYLRYQGSLQTRLNEFVMLIVARQWSQQFEWFVHYPLALKAASIAASRTRWPKDAGRAAWRMTSRPRMTSVTSCSGPAASATRLTAARSTDSASRA
jgi:4-carboxymuconolactone decarboxylase